MSKERTANSPVDAAIEPMPDMRRRRLMLMMGLVAGAAYAAPAVIGLSGAEAKESHGDGHSESGGGGRSGGRGGRDDSGGRSSTRTRTRGRTRTRTRGRTRTRTRGRTGTRTRTRGGRT
jgi:hypothetical protein